MFSRQNRLSREEIDQVMKVGKNSQNSLFSLKIINNPANRSKFAFIASKKECGGSVSRNKARRRARAAMAKIAPSLLSPIFCIMFIKKEFLKADFKVIHAKIKEILTTGGFLKKQNSPIQ